MYSCYNCCWHVLNVGVAGSVSVGIDVVVDGVDVVWLWLCCLLSSRVVVAGVGSIFVGSVGIAVVDVGVGIDGSWCCSCG